MNSRLSLLLAGILFTLSSHAQVQFAFFAGPQATSARYKVDAIRQPTSYKYGYMGGVAVKAEFDNQLYFFPSVYYSLKGYKVTLNNPAFPPTEYAKNNNVSLHTLAIAPLFHYDFNKKAAHFFARFGPSVDFAISGREKFDTVSTTGQTASIDRPMVFSYTDYGRYTAQAILHFGYENGRGLMVFAFYERGFGSLNNADDGPKIFHRILGISAGWLFGRNPLVMDTRPLR